MKIANFIKKGKLWHVDALRNQAQKLSPHAALAQRAMLLKSLLIPLKAILDASRLVKLVTLQSAKSLLKLPQRSLTALKSALVTLNGGNDCHGRQSSIVLVSLIIYYPLTIYSYDIFFDSSNLPRLCETSANDAALYYLFCGLIPLLSLFYMSVVLLFDSHKASPIAKLVSCVYFLLLSNNAIMAVDAATNLNEWEALNAVDDFINGSPEMDIPVGAADVVLLAAGVICLMLKLLSFRR